MLNYNTQWWDSDSNAWLSLGICTERDGGVVNATAASKRERVEQIFVEEPNSLAAVYDAKPLPSKIRLRHLSQGNVSDAGPYWRKSQNEDKGDVCIAADVIAEQWTSS